MSYPVLHQVSFMLSLPLAVAVSLQAQSAMPVPPVQTIISRMEQARAKNRGQLRAYKVTRNYRLFGRERRSAKAEVTADLTFVPPNTKAYKIRYAKGMGLGEKIVREMLESETQIIETYGATDISPVNYDLRYLREQEMNGKRCYLLEMVPRRADKMLLRGTIWVDAATYLLQRTEGEPAKSASWWLRDVRIALVYGNVEGMWLQTASESTVNVRLFGEHTMVARDVEYEMVEDLAEAARVPQPAPQPTALQGAFAK